MVKGAIEELAKISIGAVKRRRKHGRAAPVDFRDFYDIFCRQWETYTEARVLEWADWYFHNCWFARTESDPIKVVELAGKVRRLCHERFPDADWDGDNNTLGMIGLGLAHLRFTQNPKAKHRPFQKVHTDHLEGYDPDKLRTWLDDRQRAVPVTKDASIVQFRML